MVPSRRLPELLEQAQTLQKQRDAFFNLPADAHLSLYVDHRSDRSVFPTHTSAILNGHGAAQIWDLAWSHDGTRLATAGGKQLQASDEECFIVVWRPKVSAERRRPALLGADDATRRARTSRGSSRATARAGTLRRAWARCGTPSPASLGRRTTRSCSPRLAAT